MASGERAPVGAREAERRLLLLRALLIVSATLWIYSPVMRGSWLMDDDLYLTQNALLNDPGRLWKIWFAPGSLIEYYPIEASVQAIQWRLWGNDTLGYHLTNILLHATGALLVWRLLGKFGLRLAWLGGFLFAVHPAMVESVAWISELKNTLSLPPFLLAMCEWIDFQERRRPGDYAAALAWFIVAMLCKISMALFPVVILLHAWWKRGGIAWRDVLASAPFWVVSVVLGFTTVLVGPAFHQAHLQPSDPVQIGGGFLARLALAGSSLAVYFFHCVWPVELLPIYPKWSIDPPSPVEFLPWLVIAGLIPWFLGRRETWGRHAMLGLGFFALNLAPFIGFTPVSYMAFTWVMDHFLYLPIVGLIGLAMAGMELGDARLPEAGRATLRITFAILLALLALDSTSYAEKFVSQETLWTYTVRRNPAAWLAHNNLGNILFETGRLPGAIREYQEALRYNPSMAEAHNNLGRALSETGQVSEAIAHYETALQINPHFAVAHINLAGALAVTGRVPEAIEHYREALVIEPGNAEARTNLEKLLAEQPSGTR